MTDEEAVEIAEKIMQEQNVDNLQGFGDITISRLKGMLIQSAKRGAQKVGPF
jgi:hypothetical protein